LKRRFSCLGLAVPSALPRRVFSLVLSVAILVGGAEPAAAKFPLPRVLKRSQVGQASYYSHRFAGRRTASGAKFRPNQLTAASTTLPLGTRAKVTNLKNGRSVEVTVTDRGPHARRRIMDLSAGAARRLGMIRAGVAKVRVKPLAPRKSRR
jgi:rare lipoprotein A